MPDQTKEEIIEITILERIAESPLAKFQQKSNEKDESCANLETV